jgi:hypothetical protein
MVKTGTITKTRMIEGFTETNGFTCIKFIEAAAIVLE